MKKILMLFVLFIGFNCFANSAAYDREERNRRAEETLNQIEKAEREKAAERYEQKHNPKYQEEDSMPGFVTVIFVMVSLGILLWAMIGVFRC